ncbi:hypothetical protein G6F57_022911 [Rhizopus arrhizus]|nr:hypothetical protein G6F57_022911 [Rhizopus arrhizus]
MAARPLRAAGAQRQILASQPAVPGQDLLPGDSGRQLAPGRAGKRLGAGRQFWRHRFRLPAADQGQPAVGDHDPRVRVHRLARRDRA